MTPVSSKPETPVVALRAATGADLGRVEALLAAHKLPLAGVAGCIDDFTVAEAGGDIVGTIGLERYPPYALLRSAAVSDEWKGKGIGRSLVNSLLEDARGRDVAAIYLLTTTAEDYFPAFGFVRITRDDVPSELMQSAEFRGACPDSATVMRLSL